MNQFIVCGILKNAQGHVLIAQRPAHKPMPLLWEFPGGKVEDGEAPDIALARELYEEIGVVIDPKDLRPLTFFSFPATSPLYTTLTLLSYTCNTWIGTPEALEGQGGIVWVKPSDLRNYQMPAPDWPIIDLLQEK